jgi:hypothetical protein
MSSAALVEADATDEQAIGLGFGATDPLWRLLWVRLEASEEDSTTTARGSHEKYVLERAGDGWLERLRNRGHLFFTFFMHWTSHVSRYAPGGMMRGGFMWQAVNGYAQLMKVRARPSARRRARLRARERPRPRACERARETEKRDRVWTGSVPQETTARTPQALTRHVPLPPPPLGRCPLSPRPAPQALLLETKRRPCEAWPESLGQCVSMQIAHNPPLLQVFINVAFARAGTHRPRSVHGGLKQLSLWLGALYEHGEALPPNLGVKSLVARLVRFALCDHFKVQAWTFIFLHNTLDALGAEPRSHLLAMLAPHARRLTRHWSPVVRSMFLHFVVFRVLHDAALRTSTLSPREEEGRRHLASAFRAALDELPQKSASPPARALDQPRGSVAPKQPTDFHYGRAARRQWEEVEAKYRDWSYSHEDPRMHRLVIDVLLEGGDGDIDAVMADDW